MTLKLDDDAFVTRGFEDGPGAGNLFTLRNGDTVVFGKVFGRDNRAIGVRKLFSVGLRKAY